LKRTRRVPPNVAGDEGPQVFRVYSREAQGIRKSPTGDVGLLYSGEGVEAVWVSKANERIDRRWFRYPKIDLLLVVRGRLRVEFKDDRPRPRVLGPGAFLVLPRGTACRAYRWPRSAAKPTVFVAFYRTVQKLNPKGRSAPIEQHEFGNVLRMKGGTGDTKAVPSELRARGHGGTVR
jgi:hypothetical protein